MFKSRDGKTMRKCDFGLWGEWADFSLKFTAQLTPQGEGKQSGWQLAWTMLNPYWPRTRNEVLLLIYGRMLSNI